MHEPFLSFLKFEKIQQAKNCKHQPKNRTQLASGKALYRPKILNFLCLLVYLVILSC